MAVFIAIAQEQQSRSMHIPDGVLSPQVCAASAAVSFAAVGYSLRRLKNSLADRTVPLTGMMSALVFAGQMVNFPIGLFGLPSVSGHLMGGVLAASMLGPWAGCLAITLVLSVQCLLFADGGIVALGVNVLNMGVVGALGGYAVLAAIRKLFGEGLRGTLAGAVIASWLSVVAASALFCAEFQLSYLNGPYDLRSIFTLMVTFHSAIGIGEAHHRRRDQLCVIAASISFINRERITARQARLRDWGERSRRVLSRPWPSPHFSPRLPQPMPTVWKRSASGRFKTS
jgi:cobalamin biosynthesis protein CbiM